MEGEFKLLVKRIPGNCDTISHIERANKPNDFDKSKWPVLGYGSYELLADSCTLVDCYRLADENRIFKLKSISEMFKSYNKIENRKKQIISEGSIVDDKGKPNDIRFQLAKEVLLTLIGKDFGSAENIQSVIKEAGTMYDFHSTLAVKYADALINKLKEDKVE